MGKLDGKIALVTGGNSGIGLATAKRFVQEGAYVFITGRRDLELDAAAREIGRNVTGVRGDVSNLGDLDRLYASLKRDNGLEGSTDTPGLRDLLASTETAQQRLRSPRPWYFLPPTTAATSRERNCLSMVVSRSVSAPVTDWNASKKPFAAVPHIMLCSASHNRARPRA